MMPGSVEPVLLGGRCFVAVMSLSRMMGVRRRAAGPFGCRQFPAGTGTAVAMSGTIAVKGGR